MQIIFITITQVFYSITYTLAKKLNFDGTQTTKWTIANPHLIKSVHISIYDGSCWWKSLIQKDEFVYLLSPIVQGFPLGSTQ